MKQVIVSLAVGAVCLGGLSSQAQAQNEEGRFAARVGYYLGNDFSVGANKGNLEGISIGADIPILKRVGGQGSLYFSPTIAFGGSLSRGGDVDGNLYRLMVTYRYDLANRGWYTGLGLGASFTSAHNNQFSDVGGFTAQFLAGYVFRTASRVQPFIEASYYLGSHSKLSGFALEAGVRF